LGVNGAFLDLVEDALDVGFGCCCCFDDVDEEGLDLVVDFDLEAV
jgi:hypothetical protein